MDAVTPALMTRCIFSQAFFIMLAMPVLNKDTGNYLTYHQLRKQPRLASIWSTSYSNKMGRLRQSISVRPQGVGKRVEGTSTIHVIYYDNISTDRHKDFTYTSVVCDFKPHKSNPYCTWITIGGNRIFYPGNVGTNTASLKLV